VAGLTGTGLTLANGANSIVVSANGNVSIVSALANGTSYNITVGSQPTNPNQVCTVSNASGAIADANVTNVAVNCVTTPPIAATLTVSFGLKQLKFSWNAVAGATFYRILQNPDGVSGFTQVGGDLTTLSTTIDIAVHRHDFPNARYLLDACNSGGCTSSNEMGTIGAALRAIGYFKASNTGGGDGFGASVALSGDGNTLAVGAPQEDSSATGIGGDQTSNSATESGAVYVFVRSAGSWTQQAYIKASNTDSYAYFGRAISLSVDGNTLAVGAPGESSNAIGINGDQANKSLGGSGAIYVYTRSADMWTQQAYVKASNNRAVATLAAFNFGGSLTLSGDGNTLAVSAVGENSNAAGINGDQSNALAPYAGAVYVFARSAGVWRQQAYVKASNTDANDQFGWSVALSFDGNTLAVGAYLEDSNAFGINGDQNTNTASASGAVYIFARDGSVTRTAGTWTQQAYVKASNNRSGFNFGYSLALSGDGNTLAVGAVREDSDATGINGDQINGFAGGAGAVYVYTRNSVTWSQQAYVKASNTDIADDFGISVVLSGDGNTLAVGALGESSNESGINGDQSNNLASLAGAVYVFARNVGVWKQQTYVKSSNTEAGDRFGYAIALSVNGNTLAVSAVGEYSGAIGIDGDQSDNSAVAAGAVYLY
jgi:hypothetical protein